MTLETRSVHEVERILREDAEHAGRVLVAVDGLLGAGKSTLSESLATSLSAAHVRVDEFVEREQGNYVAHLKITELSERLRRDLASHSIVLLDAVCSAAVLDRLGAAADVAIYVRRLDSRSEWFDGEVFTSGMSEAEAIAEEEAAARAFSDTLSPLVREVMRYHFRYRPWERADILYEHPDAEA